MSSGNSGFSDRESTPGMKLSSVPSSGGGGSGVSSFNTRSGAVTPQSADYSSFYDAIGAANAVANAIAAEIGAANGIASLDGGGKVPVGEIPTLNQNTTGNAATATAAAGLESATTTVVVSGATAPTAGQVLTATSGTAADWQTPGGGGGNAAPASATLDTSSHTVSSTNVMCGFGVTYKPTGSGKVLVTVCGAVWTNTGAAGVTAAPRYGTGAAPANGAADTGTRWGTTIDPAYFTQVGGGAAVGFAYTAVLTLTPGTTYWFDLVYATSNTGFGANIEGGSISFAEL